MVAVTTPLASLLCPCGTALATSALAIATGRCSDCQPELPPVVWDFIERGRNAAHVEANYYVHCIEGAPGAMPNVNGGFAQRRYFRFGAEFSGGSWDIGDIAEGTCPDAETLSGIEHDMLSSQRKYQGKVIPSVPVAFGRAAETVQSLEEARAEAEEAQRASSYEPIEDQIEPSAARVGGGW